MTSTMNWVDAIIAVLKDSDESMHYTDIADEIADRNLRTDLGFTPATTVNVTMSTSIRENGGSSPFIRTSKGHYTLHRDDSSNEQIVADENTPKNTGLINAFGMYWARDKVYWQTHPKILGQQQPNSEPINFSNQNGVYLLHDGRQVVYVGRTTDQPLGVRLRQHITDRLNGRWDRFSWFGVYSVMDDGKLDLSADGNYDLNMLIITMEALLIEGLEPPQNRKRGDDFRAIEFLQVEDPEVQKDQILQLIEKLKTKL